MNSTMNSSKQNTLNMSEDSQQDMIQNQLAQGGINRKMVSPEKKFPTKNELIEELKFKDLVNDDNTFESLSMVSSQFN